MKNIKMLLVAATIGASAMLGGCAYGWGGVTQDGKVVLTRNDMFLFGLLRKVFVCQVTPGGLTACSEGESP